MNTIRQRKNLKNKFSLPEILSGFLFLVILAIAALPKIYYNKTCLNNLTKCKTENYETYKQLCNKPQYKKHCEENLNKKNVLRTDEKLPKIDTNFIDAHIQEKN